MKSDYKVLFATKQYVGLDVLLSPPTSDDKGAERQRRKSRGGCQECKRRRVKCDESFPICLRCQRRGSTCIMDPKTNHWKLELPGVTMNGVSDYTLSLGEHVDSRLLRHWLDKTSQIMVLNPEINPLSFPILSLMTVCPWLASVLQSVSAGHEHNFDASLSTQSLDERGRALKAFARQINAPDQPLVPMLLGVFLLGVSSCWIEGDPSQFGREHLIGGRAIFDLLISQPNSKHERMDWFAIGTYIYWDMSCSLLVDPAEQKPLNTPKVYAAVSEMRNYYHPIAGYMSELFYLLATLGRYCRRVVSLGECDSVLEETIEEQLLLWKPLGDDELMMLGEAFRDHGLIPLYRVCGAFPSGVDIFASQEETEDYIYALAFKTAKALSAIPISSSHTALQPIPLLTAGSELREGNVKERQEVKNRYKAMYSMNRTPVNTWALQLLDEMWELRRNGIVMSWVELMLSKNWSFSFS